MPRLINVREHARKLASGGRTLVSRHKRKIAVVGTILVGVRYGYGRYNRRKIRLAWTNTIKEELPKRGVSVGQLVDAEDNYRKTNPSGDLQDLAIKRLEENGKDPLILSDFFDELAKLAKEYSGG